MKNLDDIITAYRHNQYMFVENATNKKVMEDLKGDYDSLVELRNRIHDSTDEETPKLYEEDHIVLDHILDFLEEVLIGAKTPKRYKVDIDYENGDFGKGLYFTISQWRKQAMEWCFADENYGLMKELYETKDEKVLDTIAEVWGVHFAEVDENDKLRDSDYANFEDETLDEFFESRFDEETYKENLENWGA